MFAHKQLELSVDYLGWKPASGIVGSQFVEPVISELIQKRLETPNGKNQLIRLFLQLTKKKLRVYREVHHKNKIEREKYPSISIADISFAFHFVDKNRKYDSIFATIFIGQNSESARPFHVHVYKAADKESARLFVQTLTQNVNTVDNLKRLEEIERFFNAQGVIRLSGLLSPKAPTSETPAVGVHANKSLNLNSGLAEELKKKFAGDSSTNLPLLLPPKDYDTFHRSQGGRIQNRRQSASLQVDSIAPSGVVIRKSMISSDSGTQNDLDNIYENMSSPGSIEPPPDYELDDFQGLNLNEDFSSLSDYSADPVKGFPSLCRNGAASSSLSSSSNNRSGSSYQLRNKDFLNNSRNSRSSGYQSELQPRFS